MANKYSASAPAGWLVDDTGHFVKVSDAEYQAAKAAVTGATTQPATATQPATTAGSSAAPTIQTGAAGSKTGASFVWEGPDGLYRVFVNGDEVFSSGDPNVAGDWARQYTKLLGSTDYREWGLEQVKQYTKDNSITTQATTTTATTQPATATQPVVRQPWVDDLYKKYFDRSATEAEMANWSKEIPLTLEKFLLADAIKYGYISTYFKGEADQKLVKAEAMIDADQNLTPEMKTMAKQVLQSYSGGIEADAPAILQTFNELKKTVIDPSYQQMIDVFTADLKGNITNKEIMRSIETEQEQMAREKVIKGEQLSLEQSGLTFSGENVKQLGTQSAYSQEQMLPFGGLPEGIIPAEQRLLASTTQQRYLEGLRNLGVTAESTLGSDKMTSLIPSYVQVGGIKGSIQSEKEQKYSSTLTSLAASQQTKNNLLTNISPLA